MPSHGPYTSEGLQNANAPKYTPTVSVLAISDHIFLLFWNQEPTYVCDGEERWFLGGPSKYAIPEEGDPWERCYQKVKDYDGNLCQGWTDQVEKLLIFVSIILPILRTC